eukprot:CAMPEP_0174251996 /NCGR_PEP_ID=MMETSP0439-20130205/1649_1 /TAXON_ID=0 /ORGANISM="Stereomyxa ramosa, Strain Chinc5" /LENGTH=248 /DNA_ID=CAMNT_0015332465 /DNA_START=609 /DNA_END=1352 /DNA_ORIENTATION=+
MKTEEGGGLLSSLTSQLAFQTDDIQILLDKKSHVLTPDNEVVGELITNIRSPRLDIGALFIILKAEYCFRNSEATHEFAKNEWLYPLEFEKYKKLEFMKHYSGNKHSHGGDGENGFIKNDHHLKSGFQSGEETEEKIEAREEDEEERSLCSSGYSHHKPHPQNIKKEGVLHHEHYWKEKETDHILKVVDLSNKVSLATGTYRWPFCLSLPLNISSSFRCVNGGTSASLKYHFSAMMIKSKPETSDGFW